MSDHTIVTMPDAATLTAKLVEVNDNSHYQERLYPLICKYLAGQEKVSLGIIVGLQLAIHDYVQDGLPPIMMVPLNMSMEGFITAITPEQIRQETLDHWASIQAQART